MVYSTNVIDDNVTWSVDPAGIVTVTPQSPGPAWVTAVATGSAVITGTAVDDPSKTATAEVTVQANGGVNVTLQ